MSAPLVTPDLSRSHCVGCYDPELCPGINYGRAVREHCEDCVLDDEFCTGTYIYTPSWATPEVGA